VKFDDRELLRAIGPKAPAGLSRENRIRLLGEAANALIEGKLPEAEARLFLAGGLLAWLRDGGRLTRDYWRVDPRRGSRRTPASIWKARHRDEGSEGPDRVE
jgi:hypothetical protein